MPLLSWWQACAQRISRPSSGKTLHTLDLFETAVSATAGALAAGRRLMSLLKVLMIAAVTAVSGTRARDLLLDRHPFFWIADLQHLGTSPTPAFSAARLLSSRSARSRPRSLSVAAWCDFSSRGPRSAPDGEHRGGRPGLSHPACSPTMGPATAPISNWGTVLKTPVGADRPRGPSGEEIAVRWAKRIRFEKLTGGRLAQFSDTESRN